MRSCWRSRTRIGVGGVCDRLGHTDNDDFDRTRAAKHRSRPVTCRPGEDGVKCLFISIRSRGNSYFQTRDGFERTAAEGGGRAPSAGGAYAGPSCRADAHLQSSMRGRGMEWSSSQGR